MLDLTAGLQSQLPNEKAITMLSGVCLNCFDRGAYGLAVHGVSHHGDATVTDTSRPLFQLNPTCGFTPVASSTSFNGLQRTNPSVTVRKRRRPRADCESQIAAILNIGAPMT